VSMHTEQDAAATVETLLQPTGQIKEQR